MPRLLYRISLYENIINIPNPLISHELLLEQAP